MDHCLQAIASHGRAERLALIYSDMHGLWGGVTLRLDGAAYERAERPQGAPEPIVTRGLLSRRQVRAVAALLIEIRAWEQSWLPAGRPLAPDESWATLVVRCGDEEARIAEPANAMASLRRLSRVRDLLGELGQQLGGHGYLRAQIARGDRNILVLGLALVAAGAGLAALFLHWFPALIILPGLLALGEWLRRRALGDRHPVYAQLARFGDQQRLAAQVDAECAAAPPDEAILLGERWLACGDTYGVALVPWEAVVWICTRDERTTTTRRRVVEVWTRDGRRLALPCGAGPHDAAALLADVGARAPWAEAGRSPELEREWRAARHSFLARVDARRAAGKRVAP